MKVEVLNPNTGKLVFQNAFQAFMEWDRAPRYDQVAFDPRIPGHHDLNFNLWQGFAINPEAGDEDLFFRDLLRRICDGNDAYVDYVQKWCAHMIQKPWERPNTTLGISGKQGLGKNPWIETLGMLLSTSQMIEMMRNNPAAVLGKVLASGAFGIFNTYDEVFGTFNTLAGNKILLFMDEATWGGFHDQKARTKTAITGQTLTINDKFMKQLTVANYRRFIFASNDQFYYGADADNRRLLPLEFKDENRPTKEWFDEYYAPRRNGKMLQNLLYRLQNIDIEGWQPYQALRELEINTGAALQSASAPEFQHWLDDVAESGCIILPGD